MDPLTSSFPWYTPYQFAGNSPIANIDLDGLEPVPSVSPGQKEGDKTTTTSEVSTPGGQPGCADCTTRTEVKVWYYHAGGLRKDNNNPVTGAASYTQAGWYSSEDYAQVLSTSRAATSLALRLKLYTFEGQARQREGVEDLSNFIGTGLSENTEKHLIAAAAAKAGEANFARTGVIHMSSFNVEDLLGIGLLLKHGLKILGGYAVRNVSSRLVEKGVLNSSVDDFIKLFKPIDEYDVIKTLYRGTTGSEGSGNLLFLTDDATVAASYIKNGGQVMKYEVRSDALFSLRQQGLLKLKEDIHKIGSKEIRHTTYQFSGSNLRLAFNQIAKPN